MGVDIYCERKHNFRITKRLCAPNNHVAILSIHEIYFLHIIIFSGKSTVLPLKTSPVVIPYSTHLPHSNLTHATERLNQACVSVHLPVDSFCGVPKTTKTSFCVDVNVFGSLNFTAVVENS